MLDWSSIYVGATRDVLDGMWPSRVRWQEPMIHVGGGEIPKC